MVGNGLRYRQVMQSGYIGILSVELHFPGAHSLKEKRAHLRSAKDHLTRRVGASIAEVDHHDAWQRARLTLSCVAREAAEGQRLLDEAERWLGAQEFVLAARERALVTLDDLDALAQLEAGEARSA